MDPIIKNLLQSEAEQPAFNSEALAVINKVAGGVQKYDDSAFADVSKSGDFLGRLQLMTSQSEVCKEGKFPINHYALINGQNQTDLGNAVDVLLIAWRPKAIDMSNKDTIITCYDNKDSEFVRIQERSGEQNSGCMFGPEFLCWVPGQKMFATFFMGSKSARREAPNVMARMKESRTATLKHQIVKTAKYTWAVPTATPCTTPFEMPDVESLEREVEKFNNPPKSEVEKVESNNGGRAV